MHLSDCSTFIYCTEAEASSGANMSEFLNNINREIKGQKIKIEKAVDENDGVEYYALIALVEHPIFKLGSLHKSADLKFLNKLLASIVSNKHGAIKMMDAVNLCKSIADEKARAKITLSIAENLIKKWVNERILSKVNDDRELTVGVRGVMELAPFLKQHYSEHCVNCHFCKRLCLRGKTCSSCNVKVHFQCETRYFAGTNTCPGCNGVWSQACNANPSQQSNRLESDDTDEDEVLSQRPKKARK